MCRYLLLFAVVCCFLQLFAAFGCCFLPFADICCYLLFFLDVCCCLAGVGSYFLLAFPIVCCFLLGLLLSASFVAAIPQKLFQNDPQSPQNGPPKAPKCLPKSIQNGPLELPRTPRRPKILCVALKAHFLSNFGPQKGPQNRLKNNFLVKKAAAMSLWLCVSILPNFASTFC